MRGSKPQVRLALFACKQGTVFTFPAWPSMAHRSQRYALPPTLWLRNKVTKEVIWGALLVDV